MTKLSSTSNSRRVGSVFGGVPEIGVSIDELMKRDAKS